MPTNIFIFSAPGFNIDSGLAYGKRPRSLTIQDFTNIAVQTEEDKDVASCAADLDLPHHQCSCKEVESSKNNHIQYIFETHPRYGNCGQNFTCPVDLPFIHYRLEVGALYMVSYQIQTGSPIKQF